MELNEAFELVAC